MNRYIGSLVGLGVSVCLLFALNLVVGSVHIPPGEVCAILMGGGAERESWRFIVLESRLPQAIVALLSGAALAVSGLLLQTTFRNPLAGPDVFGINGGAGLGVALVMLLYGGSVVAGSFSLTGSIAILLAAFAGAMAVTAIILFFSTLVHSRTMLLIVGIMVGYLSSSVISLLNFFATQEGVKSYLVWGMGHFGGVSMAQLPLFSVLILLGLGCSMLQAKPLNVLLLGDAYAENLGVRTVTVRRRLLAVTGLLTAVVTAYCGPVAFIGLAVPHVARLLLRTDDHHRLLPATILAGAGVALACNVVCFLPGEGGMIPLNAVTPLIGAPVVIYVIARKR
ncbi:MAG: iron ABC transporter permease [Prevotella sp.]|nr:iron ABC transporter permease [Prevotella sp.]